MLKFYYVKQNDLGHCIGNQHNRVLPFFFFGIMFCFLFLITCFLMPIKVFMMMMNYVLNCTATKADYVRHPRQKITKCLSLGVIIYEWSVTKQQLVDLLNHPESAISGTSFFGLKVGPYEMTWFTTGSKRTENLQCFKTCNMMPFYSV